MRFTRTKTVITTFYDGEISKPESVLTVLKAICKKEFVCEISLKNRPPNQKALITEVYEDGSNTFKAQIIDVEANLDIIENVTNIIALNLDTTDDIQVEVDHNVTRWELLVAADPSWREEQ